MRSFFLVIVIGVLTALAQIPTNVALTPAFGTSGTNHFINPVWFGEVPGKSGTFLVVEQGGISTNTDSARIYVLVPNGSGGYTKQKFLSLKVRQDMPEMGLLGIAFHPGYVTNRKYYINYIPPTRGSFDSTLIEERTAAASLVVDAGTAPRRILGIQQPKANHNGGTLAFGKDGFLYIGMGDGGEDGSGIQTLLGSMLRIDVDHPANGLGYSIPSDNPLVSNTTAGVRKEIWAYGLRNPWKWSFDPLNGDLWVGDVGESTAEDVDKVAKGNNMGWTTMEGSGCFSYSTVKPVCNKTSLTLPVMDFTRTQAQSIIGGYVFRGNPSSVFYGAYIFGDWALHKVYALKLSGSIWQLTQIASSSVEISSFGTDSKGNIYVVGHNTGIIYLLDHTALVPVPIELRQKKPGTGLHSPRLIPVMGGNEGEYFLSNVPDMNLFSLNGDKVHPQSAGIYIAR